MVKAKPTKKKVKDFHPGDVVEFKIRGVVVRTFTRMVRVKVDQLPYVGTLPVPPAMLKNITRRTKRALRG